MQDRPRHRKAAATTPSGLATKLGAAASKPRRLPKLAVDGVLFGVVEHFLKECWSPGQIAGAMNMMWPEAPERRVAAETIYTCLYALPRGALRQELIAACARAHHTRLPRREARIVADNWLIC
jgi:IS30 family transposase